MKMFIFEKIFGASEVARDFLRRYPGIRQSKEYKNRLRYIGMVTGGCNNAAERMEWLQHWMVEAITADADNADENSRHVAAVQFLTAYDSI